MSLLSKLLAAKKMVDPPLGELGSVWHSDTRVGQTCIDWVVVGPHMLMSGWIDGRRALPTVIEYTNLNVMHDLNWHLSTECPNVQP